VASKAPPLTSPSAQYGHFTPPSSKLIYYFNVFIFAPLYILRSPGRCRALIPGRILPYTYIL
jgi:hypothetical protein